MRAIRSGRFLGSIGNAGPVPRHNRDLAVLRAGIPGLRGLTGPGLGATVSGSASGSGSTDWASIIGAATEGAAKIIDSARADTSPDASVGSSSAPLYTPQYTAPAPTPPAVARSSQWVSGVDNGVVLGVGAVVLLGGVYLMTRGK